MTISRQERNSPEDSLHTHLMMTKYQFCLICRSVLILPCLKIQKIDYIFSGMCEELSTDQIKEEINGMEYFLGI